MRVTSGGKTRTQAIDAPLMSWTAHPWHVSQEGAFAACSHFLDRFQRGIPADTSGADNLRTFALVEAAYLAAETHVAQVPFSWGPV